MHKEVFLRKAINLIIFLSFFYCKQEHNLKTDDNREQNKTSLPSTVSDPENSLCYSLPLEPSFLQVSHISLKKYLPTSKLSHYCSQIACLLKSSVFKVRLLLPSSWKWYLSHTTTIFGQWKRQTPVLRKPSPNQTLNFGDLWARWGVQSSIPFVCMRNTSRVRKEKFQN